MSMLVITRGLPGCGKTTYARAWVSSSPLTRSRVNRDDLGVLMHDGRFYGQGELYEATEGAITLVQLAQIKTLLALGRDVICDDTNLDEAVVERLQAVAAGAGAGFEVVNLIGVPMDVVLKRNAQRSGTAAFVPESVIWGMWERYFAEAAA